MKKGDLKKAIKEAVTEALEPFRVAYAEQARENAKLSKSLRELTVEHARVVLGGTVVDDSKR